MEREVSPFMREFRRNIGVGPPILWNPLFKKKLFLSKKKFKKQKKNMNLINIKNKIDRNI